MKKIEKIAKKHAIFAKNLKFYGDYIAKLEKIDGKKKGRLILVTAMTPTKSGEGKTTVSIGLADALTKLGKSACLSLREPSLGPVFGLKGGATGGGKSVILPQDEINLHFTGDFHAITSANNLLCAMIDNHIFQGNELGYETVEFSRCMDMNDRALRDITINQEPLKNNVERKEHFVITPASEIMAILCLSTDFADLKRRLGNIITGYNHNGEPILARDLKADGAMAKLLEDAIKPNLVQTNEGTLAFVHGGPFANIAHGCSSVIATKSALACADYVVTEAGFGADLGAEKFIDLLSRNYDLAPDVCVLVVTIKALKGQGSMEKGLDNLSKHIENLTKVFNQKVVIAINHFDGDSEEDYQKVRDFAKGIRVEVCSPFTNGAQGTVELAKAVLSSLERKTPTFSYRLEDSVEKKIEDLAKNVYGAKNVEFDAKIAKKIEKINKKHKNLPIIVAKTQYSLSDNDKLLGRPSDFTFHVDNLEVKSGAEFIVAVCGKINLMPGLPKAPNAETF